jgi:D-alanyl-D-alanine carboxypeptidase (penicillin-binding protein 5/6)
LSILKRINQLVLSLLAVVTLAGIFAGPAQASNDYNNFADQDVSLQVKSAIAIDANTGQLLYAKNANKKLPIASMTKLITVYLTLRAIKEKKLSWQTKVKPTAAISKVANNKDYSNVPLNAKHYYNIKQLYQATLIESANGAAMCLGQAVAGSQTAFVKQMRQQVARWGIKDAKIYTACGLPNGNVGQAAYPGVGKNEENELSARDMAIISRQLLGDFPQVLKTTKIAHLDFKDQNKTTTMANFNWMLKGLSQYSAAFPVDGLKTGTTDKAGACFVATMKKGRSRVISVVMGARHKDGNDPSRFWQTKKLLSAVFHNYQPVTLNAGEKIAGASQLPVTNGQSQNVVIGLQQQTTIWDPVDGQSLKTKLTPSQAAAPIKSGQTIACYRFNSKGQQLASIYNPQTQRYQSGQLLIPGQAMQSVGKVNIFVQIWHWLFGGR